MKYLLGIDAGSTLTKVVLFSEDGAQVAQASRQVRYSQPEPNFVERDQEELWSAVKEATKEVISRVDKHVRESIVGIGITSHGDGLYFVDSEGNATRPGIMSFDTRASEVVHRWREQGLIEKVFDISGQVPWPSSPAAILAWMADHEKEVLEKSRWALPAKDALKARMTGIFTTDRTESSLAFTNYQTQEYSTELLELLALEQWDHLLPPVTDSTEIIGTVLPGVAAELGLSAGVQVAASAHDVDCSAIGSGVIDPGTLSVVAGSFSINQVISVEPRIDPGWYARNFIHSGAWMNMSISPTSSANFNWVIEVLGVRGFDEVTTEIQSIEKEPSEIIFTPLLFGSPFDPHVPASFSGMRSWHTRGHLLRAVMEGVALMHRFHVDQLRKGFEITSVQLTGGASRNQLWCQIFSDVLNLPIHTTLCQETGALGSALLAGVGTGVYSDLDQAVKKTVKQDRSFAPNQKKVSELNLIYQQFLELAQNQSTPRNLGRNL